MIFSLISESLREIVGSFLFAGREKYRMLYGRQRAFIERRNYYDESNQELYEQAVDLGTYFKLCGVVYGLYLAVIGAYMAWEKWQEHKELKKIQKANQEEYEF